MSDPLEIELEQDPIDRALDHLRQALKILDAEDVSAEFGARLDHLICSLETIKESPHKASPGEKPWAH